MSSKKFKLSHYPKFSKNPEKLLFFNGFDPYKKIPSLLKKLLINTASCNL